MRILSINITHDASACILNDGILEFYFKEERLFRKKRCNLSINSLVQCINSSKGKIDYVLCNFNTQLLDKNTCDFYCHAVSRLAKVPNENILDYNFDHHLSHAGVAFYNSGFDKCLVVVVDNEGSKYEDAMSECESVYVAEYPSKFKPLIKNFYRNSSYNYLNEVNQEIIEKCSLDFNCECNYNGSVGGIVKLYSTASELIQQSSLENGKVMGLSSYGKKIKNFPKLFENGTEKVNEQLFDYIDVFCFKNKSVKSPMFKPYLEKRTKEVTKFNYEFYADYSFEIQTQTQEIVGDLIERAVKKTSINKVCIVGGYGMNVVANHYYLNRFPNVDFYFEPLSDDSGITIGAAKVFYYGETSDKKIRPLKTTSFHGSLYDVSKYKGKSSSISEIAKLLYSNNSVSVYSGLAESGQRSLGNRSIFFNALNPDAKDIVNKIKKREWYRPFAAAVLEEDANIYFDMGRIKSSPFMTICFPVNDEYIKVIPGVTHIDSTCRIQTVPKSDFYLYHLLKEFKKLTGHGILLNTSFNLAGEPLVETPEDAFDTLNKSCLDYLWFEETNQLFKRKKELLKYE